MAQVYHFFCGFTDFPDLYHSGGVGISKATGRSAVTHRITIGYCTAASDRGRGAARNLYCGGSVKGPENVKLKT